MVIAISTADPREFILECDRRLPEAEQTVWLVRYFTVDQHVLLTNLIKAGTKREDWAEMVLMVLRCGLVGVRNFRDANGVEIVFEETGRRVGMKPAGGIRNAKQAVQTLVLVHETLGLDWLTPDLFRFGASSLLNDVLMQIRKEKTGRYQSPDYFTID